MPRPRICLNAIVKNEAANLPRLLESVAPWIDEWTIADTGSTDGTPELIEAFFEMEKIPGTLCRWPFVDFATTRNRALDFCRQSSTADWILLADADMELVVRDRGWREDLVGYEDSVTALSVLQESSSARYRNLRLVRRAYPARYEGATHEYLNVGGAPRPTTDRFFFRDHESGSSRAEKLSRDEALLRAELEADPTNARVTFYLGQTLQEAGRPVEAIACYAARVTMRGWEEERWMASWRMALCKRALGDVDGFVSGALSAWGARPTRAEPLLALARHWRSSGQHELALAMVDLGSRIPMPDELFVEKEAYGEGFEQELSICGFYSSDPIRRERGRRAADALSRSSSSEAVRALAKANLAFYYGP